MEYVYVVQNESKVLAVFANIVDATNYVLNYAQLELGYPDGEIPWYDVPWRFGWQEIWWSKEIVRE